MPSQSRILVYNNGQKKNSRFNGTDCNLTFTICLTKVNVPFSTHIQKSLN